MRRPRPLTPSAGQESVWDYPRPPRVEPVAERITIRLGGDLIADTRDAVRVLETSHPPVYYLPIADFIPGALVEAPAPRSASSRAPPATSMCAVETPFALERPGTTRTRLPASRR